MNIMYRIVVVFSLILFFSISVAAQTSPVLKELTYKAYTLGKISLWDDAIDQAKKAYLESESDSALHDLIMVQYGYISFSIAEKLNDKGKEMLLSAYENIEMMENDWWGEADLLAIQASMAAFELNLYPHKMMKLVPRALELTDLAYESDKNNYMALACKANQLNFTPRMFGGSPTDAIPLYRKIITLYETNCVDRSSNWRYVSTMVTLAGTYENLKMYNEACGIYEKIILFDNNINWINTNLYPACKAKLIKQQ